MKKLYTITLDSCHDYTEFEMKLTPEQLKLVKEICDRSRTSSEFSCMPIMTVKEVADENE